MARKIRISKKSLKEPDDFISFGSKLVEYTVTNWKKTLILIVALFGSLGVYALVSYYMGNLELKTQEDISRVVNLFQEKGILDADSIIILERSSRKGGNITTRQISHLYLGNHYYGVDAYDVALKHYDAILEVEIEKSDKLVRNLALMGAGYSLEQSRKFSEAKERFMELVNDPGSTFADAAIISAARCTEQMGESKAAAELYSRVESEYPDSPFLSEAKERLELLNPSATSKINN